jgi:Tol biopolymer transport system component
MTSIFISYSRSERTMIQQLAAQLRRIYGVDEVWYDEDISGGQRWWDEIRRQIAACEIFMFMLSEDSATSEYCRKEYEEAQRQGKEILPVRIKPIPPEKIPNFLSAIQYVDLSASPEAEIAYAENIIRLAAAINPLSRDFQTKLQQKRRRLNLLRLASVSIFAIIVGAILAITVSRYPSFDGGITYVSARENNVEIKLVSGGFSGLWGNLQNANPTAIPIQPLPGGNIVPRPASDAGLAWSADGKKVAFVSSRDGDADIYVMNADGSNVSPLTVNNADDRNPDWSPDGAQIVFASNIDGDYEIYVINLDGTGLQNITNNPDWDDKYPAWSPRAGSERIAFASNRDGDWDIWRTQLDGSDVVNLTNNFPEEDTFPAWSPDSNWIAFQSNQGEAIDLEDPLSELGIDGSASSAPVCSVDNWNIFAVNAVNGANSALVPVAQNSLFNEQYPSWSPDGRSVSFISNQGGDADLYVVRFNDSTAQPFLINNDDGDVDGFPVWRP